MRRGFKSSRQNRPLVNIRHLLLITYYLLLSLGIAIAGSNRGGDRFFDETRNRVSLRNFCYKTNNLVETRFLP